MKSFGTSKSFLLTKDKEWETVGEGVKRKIMGYDDKIMLVPQRAVLDPCINTIIHK
jgi:hypothetical protein